ARGCLVTPGLVNTHHHLYQNLTRSFGPVAGGTLFEWLRGLYPLWARLDEEASWLAAWVGLAELALGGCTTTSDHLYVAPAGGGDLWSAEIAAAADLGLRFHATRGWMTLSVKDAGLPPDQVVQDEDAILADCERLIGRHHDPAPGAMVRVGIAPPSPSSVRPPLILPAGAPRRGWRSASPCAGTPTWRRTGTRRPGAWSGSAAARSSSSRRSAGCRRAPGSPTASTLPARRSP